MANIYLGSQVPNSPAYGKFETPLYAKPYYDYSEGSRQHAFAYPQIKLLTERPTSLESGIPINRRWPIYPAADISPLGIPELARALGYSSSYIFNQLILDAEFVNDSYPAIGMPNRILQLDITALMMGAFRLSGFKLSGNFSLSFSYTDDIEKNNFDKLSCVIRCFNQGAEVVPSQLITGVTDETNKKVVLTLQNSQMIDNIYLAFTNYGGYIGYEPGHCRLLTSARDANYNWFIAQRPFKASRYFAPEAFLKAYYATGSSNYPEEISILPVVGVGIFTAQYLRYYGYPNLQRKVANSQGSTKSTESIDSDISVLIQNEIPGRDITIYLKYCYDAGSYLKLLDASIQTEFVVPVTLSNPRFFCVRIVNYLTNQQMWGTIISLRLTEPRPKSFDCSIVCRYSTEAASHSKEALFITQGDLAYTTRWLSMPRVLATKISGGQPAADAELYYLKSIEIVPFAYLCGTFGDAGDADTIEAFLNDYFAES